MNLRQMRIGELLALAGAGCVIASLLTRWYESPIGNLDAWNTFGPSVALLMAGACAALVLVLTALTERSTALPVSAAVWCVALGLVAVIAAVVRVLERPNHATSLCIGAWLALVGALAILVGAWQALRDERGSLYSPPSPKRRPAP
jgi:peptidoglycan/LPS O-acetylase OafA/YrhL